MNAPSTTCAERVDRTSRCHPHWFCGGRCERQSDRSICDNVVRLRTLHDGVRHRTAIALHDHGVPELTCMRFALQRLADGLRRADPDLDPEVAAALGELDAHLTAATGVLRALMEDLHRGADSPMPFPDALACLLDYYRHRYPALRTSAACARDLEPVAAQTRGIILGILRDVFDALGESGRGGTLEISARREHPLLFLTVHDPESTLLEPPRQRPAYLLGACALLATVGGRIGHRVEPGGGRSLLMCASVVHGEDAP